VLIFGAGVGTAIWARSQQAAVNAELAALETRARALSASSVAPTAENVEKARADRDRTALIAADLLASLTEARDPLAPRPYAGAQELYFEIAAYVDRMRATATAAGVSLPADEQFGFGSFVAARQVILPGSEESPESQAAMGRVDQQLQALEMILNGFFAAQPTAVRAIERTPVTVAPGARAENPGIDLFQADPLLTAAQPDAIHTEGFRLAFTGRTHVLREFLQNIAALPVSIVVRGVEVSPVESAPPKPAGARSAANGASSASPSNPAPAADSPFAVFGNRSRSRPVENAETSEVTPSTPAPTPAAVPIVEANLSEFVVILEYYELLPVADAETEEWQ
jgi:hypothetical protein